LQGILILVVVITYQIAKRRLAARQLQRAAAAGDEAVPRSASGSPDPGGAGEPKHQPVDRLDGEER
jgi:hypothetical protein